ncbi:hypothetical protein ACIPWL_29410 [Streptomyces sp. NPDC090023]|uniref:hypothetical protein n=1 Tax=unclassified Streptomyces TaxID=2593676 RepID=UPI0038034D78
MSPVNKRRWRFAAAAITANTAGAATGFLLQLLIREPTTSILGGTIVSGTVGDLLLQAADAGATPRKRPTFPAPAAPIKPPAAHDGQPRHRPAPRPPCTGHRYARRRRSSAPGAPLTPVQTPTLYGQGSSEPQAKPPQHPRHRHLHRAAQRRVRSEARQTPGAGHGTP